MSKRGDSLLFGFHKTITDEQYDVLQEIATPTNQTNIIIIEALAGTGKTFISTMGAKLRGKTMEYIFAPVQSDEQGFIPGDPIEKDAPYLTPIKQALIKLGEDPNKSIGDPRLNQFMNSNAWVYAHSHTYDRGITYDSGRTVVIDEAQNFTKHQLRKEITRCDDSCKIIIMGNMKQCDLPNPESSGFLDYMEHAIGIPWIKKMPLTHNFRGRVAQWGDEI